MSQRTATVRNAFTGFTGSFRAYADADGTVRVYDSTAGYWTTCHALTPAQESRVRRVATRA